MRRLSLGRLSLRARLVLGVIAIAALGLAVADVATYASLRSFLIDRTDSALDAEHLRAGRLLDGARGRPGPRIRPGLGGALRGGGGRGAGGEFPGDFVQVRSPSGAVLATQTSDRFGQATTQSPPSLPASFDLHASPEPNEQVAYVTVPAEDGESRYRVRASVGLVSPNMLIVATPLDDVDSTLDRLLLIELIVTAGVL